MNLLKYVRNVLIVTELSLRTTTSFMIIKLLEYLIMPFVYTVFVALSVVVTGGVANIRVMGLFFTGMMLASLVQTIPQYISNYLMMPPVRDLLTSLAGDIRLFVISVGIEHFVEILPQVVIVSILTNNLELIIYTFLVYFLVIYPLGALIGTIVRTPGGASFVGLILELILLMTMPMYLTTTTPIWRIIPLSILNPSFGDIPQIVYTILLSLPLYYVLLKRI